MANVHDVAAYILRAQGSMSAMKLQKLAYYSQAWHLVWEEKPLFDDEIQAWANGPVVPSLYRDYRGQFMVESSTGNPDLLTPAEKGSIDGVLKAYAPFTAHQLSEMTHRERPWRSARAGVPDGVRSTATISLASMHEYYHGLS